MSGGKKMNEKDTEMIKIVGKDTLKILINCSYPIAGNFPFKYQERIQQTTNELFNPEDAFKTTLVTNPIIYILGCASLGAYLPDSESENISEHKIAGGAIGGVCAAGYAVMENVIRNDVKKVNKKILASLPFYVTFLPFRILSAAKKYFMTV